MLEAELQHPPVTTGNSRRTFGWLLAWLVFGLLAGYESGALAMRTGSSDALALVYGACSLGAFFVLAVRAVSNARPGGLRALVFISLIALLACLWAIYGDGDRSDWVTTAMFGIAYSGFCLVVGSIVMTVAWRRRRAKEVHVVEEHAQRDRRRRMEGIRAETAALTSQADKDGFGPDSDFTLPSRPKWDDS